jgi:ribonuclease HI
LREEGHFLGEATNNVAEYRAVIAALARAGEMGASEVDLFSDSELLVRQMNGVYKVRNEGLRPLFDEATRLTRAFSRCELHHVRREKNKEADAMVNRALDMKRDVGDIEEPY